MSFSCLCSLEEYQTCILVYLFHVSPLFFSFISFPFPFLLYNQLATRIPIPSQRSQKLSWTRQPVLPFLRDMALNCELYTTSSSTPTLFLVSCYHFLYESKQKKIMPSFYSIHHRPTLFFSLSLSICHPFSSFLPFASSAFIYTCCIPSHSFSSKSYAFFFSMEVCIHFCYFNI